MAVISDNFEPLCYGATSEEVAAMIDNDQYLDVKGPFLDMRECERRGAGQLLSFRCHPSG